MRTSAQAACGRASTSSCFRASRQLRSWTGISLAGARRRRDRGIHRPPNTRANRSGRRGATTALRDSPAGAPSRWTRRATWCWIALAGFESITDPTCCVLRTDFYCPGSVVRIQEDRNQPRDGGWKWTPLRISRDCARSRHGARGRRTVLHAAADRLPMSGWLLGAATIAERDAVPKCRSAAATSRCSRFALSSAASRTARSSCCSVRC